MIIFLYGEDTFRSKQKLKELFNKFTRDIDKSSLNISRLDGGLIDIETLEQSIYAGGFLVKKRMIVIENFIEKNKKKKDKKDSKIVSDVVELLKRWNNPANNTNNIVIFWERLGSKSSKYNGKALSGKLFNYLKKEQHAYEFPHLNKNELVSWTRGEIEKRGGRIRFDALQLLVDFVGGDLWRMTNEIDKLIYYNDGTVEINDIKAIVESRFDEDIFKLVDAIADKDKKGFVKLLNEHIGAGVDQSYVLSMLIRQFRLLIYAIDRINSNPYASLSKDLGIHWFVERKIKNQIKKYKINQLKNIYGQLLSIDVHIKQGYFDTELLFYNLIK